MMAEGIIKPALKKYAAEALEELGRLNRYLQETEEMARAKQQLEAIVTPEKYPVGVPEKIGDDLYVLQKNGDEIFRGTKKEVDELVEQFKKMLDADLQKILDELLRNIPKLTSDNQFWTCINISGTELRWKVERNIMNSIKNAKSSSRTATQWEGKVAEAFSEIDEVRFVSTVVEEIKGGVKVERVGDFDVYTNKYLVECKESLGVGVLNGSELKKQIEKYLDKTNVKYMNVENKKVIVAIKEMGAGASLKHPTIKYLFDLAKKNNIELEFITHINQIKNLK